MDLSVGTCIKDRYELKEFIGRGSFGEVWLAHDCILDSDVAVKIYIALDSLGIEEFKTEHMTTQGLSHPNLLTSLHFDVWEQHPFLIMKYCSGGSSSKLVGKIDENTLWKFIHDVASGLSVLHGLSDPIIHQDIKPDNILLDNGSFMITDFGISKKVRSTMRRQSTRAVGAGATAYMGPERFERQPMLIKASDIWSLGASIHELATGELPFNGLGGSMLKHGAEMPVLDDMWSKEMNLVMQSCMAKEPWNRPTALQLVDYADEKLKGNVPPITWNFEESGSSDEAAYSGNKDGFNSNSSDTISAQEAYKPKTGNFFVRNLKGFITAFCVFFLIGFVKYIINDEEQVKYLDHQTDTEKAISNPKKREKDNDIPLVSTSNDSLVKNEKTNTKIPVESENAENELQSKLNSALARGDYQSVQKLANDGFAPAYGPLAKYYLKNNEYNLAETYARKAKNAGYKDGNDVITTLKNLGYFD